MKMFFPVALGLTLLIGTSAGQEEADPAPVRDMDAVVEILGGLSNAIQEAYYILLLESPEVGGELEISFSITPGGAVEDIDVTGPEDLEDVMLVIEEELVALDFGECEQQMDNLPITAPLVLSPPTVEYGDDEDSDE